MKDSICVTTFIFGEKYQEYLPLLLYSIKKSYPEYNPVIFLHDEIKEDLKNRLKLVKKLGCFTIKEKYFYNIKKLKRSQGKALRWVLRDEIIKEHDYVYFIDSDIIYIREPTALHIQHIKHMDLLDLPFSNIMRRKVNNNRSLDTLDSRYNCYGIKNAVRNFLKGTVIENRLTGLHFVRTKDYFPKIRSAQRKYEKLLSSKEYLKYFQGLSDEPILYQICKESGFELENLYLKPIKDENRDQEKFLQRYDYDNFDQRNFRPHHGIHLGMFRDEPEGFSKILADSDTYEYYIQKLKKYLEDQTFVRIIEESNSMVSRQLNNLFEYYGIQTDELNLLTS